MKKNKGFTLIELLAVIIVLAIIMVLTIPNVLSTMNNSKKKALQVFGKKAIVQAQKYVAEQELAGTPVNNSTNVDLDFSVIGLTDTGSYYGTVTYTTTGDYKVNVSDKNNYICQVGLDNIDKDASVSPGDGSGCAGSHITVPGA